MVKKEENDDGWHVLMVKDEDVKNKSLLRKLIGGPVTIKKADIDLKQEISKPVSIEHKKKHSGIEIKHKKNQDLLNETLSELNKELEKLKAQKKALENELKKASKDMKLTQNEESKLRSKISALVEKEYMLNQKKSEIIEKLGELKEKLNKISKIEEQIKEIE